MARKTRPRDTPPEKPPKKGSGGLGGLFVIFFIGWFSGRCSNEPPTPAVEATIEAPAASSPAVAYTPDYNASRSADPTTGRELTQLQAQEQQQQRIEALAKAMRADEPAELALVDDNDRDTAAPVSAGTARSPPPGASGSGYVNTFGDLTPSPTFTEDGNAPPGASAQCRDGSYSFSASRRGTCSHHGGVARWL